IKECDIYINRKYDSDNIRFKILESHENIENIEKIVVITNKKDFLNNYINEHKRLDIDKRHLEEKIIKVIPKDLVIGIGCRRNTDSELLKESLYDLLEKYNIDIKSIKEIGRIDIKREEKKNIEI